MKPNKPRFTNKSVRCRSSRTSSRPRASRSPRHITAKQLPEDEQLGRLSPDMKHFVDLVKMIACRAETAMAQMLTESMSRPCDARSLVRDIYHTEANLLPDHNSHTLTVRLHHTTNPAADDVVAHACEELNHTETSFPGTDLALRYELVPTRNRQDQKV